MCLSSVLFRSRLSMKTTPVRSPCVPFDPSSDMLKDGLYPPLVRSSYVVVLFPPGTSPGTLSLLSLERYSPTSILLRTVNPRVYGHMIRMRCPIMFGSLSVRLCPYLVHHPAHASLPQIQSTLSIPVQTCPPPPPRLHVPKR